MGSGWHDLAWCTLIGSAAGSPAAEAALLFRGFVYQTGRRALRNSIRVRGPGGNPRTREFLGSGVLSGFQPGHQDAVWGTGVTRARARDPLRPRPRRLSARRLLALACSAQYFGGRPRPPYVIVSPGHHLICLASTTPDPILPPATSAHTRACQRPDPKGYVTADSADEVCRAVLGLSGASYGQLRVDAGLLADAGHSKGQPRRSRGCPTGSSYRQTLTSLLACLELGTESPLYHEALTFAAAAKVFFNWRQGQVGN